MAEKIKMLVLGSLKLQAVNPVELAQFRRTLEVKTFAKIKEDVKRSQRNVAIARKFITY